jgi:hypothetical protein
MTPCHQGVKEHGDGLGYPGLLACAPDRHHAESAPCIMQGCRGAGAQGRRSSMKITTDMKSIFQQAKPNKPGVNHIVKTTPNS